MTRNAKQEVGTRLRAVREQFEMNQTTFAKEVSGCSQGFVSDVETGTRNVPPILVSRRHEGARVAGKVVQLVRTRFV